MLKLLLWLVQKMTDIIILIWEAILGAEFIFSMRIKRLEQETRLNHTLTLNISVVFVETRKYKHLSKCMQSCLLRPFDSFAHPLPLAMNILKSVFVFAYFADRICSFLSERRSTLFQKRVYFSVAFCGWIWFHKKSWRWAIDVSDLTV